MMVMTVVIFFTTIKITIHSNADDNKNNHNHKNKNDNDINNNNATTIHAKLDALLFSPLHFPLPPYAHFNLLLLFPSSPDTPHSSNVLTSAKRSRAPSPSFFLLLPSHSFCFTIIIYLNFHRHYHRCD